MNPNDELAKLRQAIDEQKQLSLAISFGYRILSRQLAKEHNLNLELLQANLRRAADELVANPHVNDLVSFQLVNLADDVLTDRYVLDGMDAQTAREQIGKNRNPDSLCVQLFGDQLYPSSSDDVDH